MNNVDVIKKLIGAVQPVGETHMDTQRLENLKEMCDVTRELMSTIYHVYNSSRNDQRFSMKKASDYAKLFLIEIRDFDVEEPQ